MTNFRGLNQRGSSLLFVIVITSVVLVGIMFTFDRLTGVAQFSSSSFKKSKSSFEAEGFVRSLMVMTKQYFQTTPSTPEQDYVSVHQEPLKRFVALKIESLTPPHYRVKAWDIKIAPRSNLVNVPSGAFVGMESRSRAVQFTATLVGPDGIETSSALEGVIGAIAYSQFEAFSFGDMIINLPYRFRIDGRVHGNGMVAIGSLAGDASAATAQTGGEFASVYRLTSPGSAGAGGIQADTRNFYRLFVATDETGGSYVEAKTFVSTEADPYNSDNVDGTGLNEIEYYLTRFRGYLLPKATFGVPALNVVTAGDLKVQNANIGEKFLIDPAMPDDDASIRREKLAVKADIRVINGVWYLKDPQDELRWPGLAIWSDHPGSFQKTNEGGMEGTGGVGQEDIRSALSSNTLTQAHAWPPGTTPKRFSYYEYDSAGEKLYDNVEGVVSYGSMAPSAGRMKPADYVANNLAGGTRSSLCPISATAFGSCSGGNCGNVAHKLLQDFETPVTCLGGAPPDAPARLLNATRSGFKYGSFAVNIVSGTDDAALDKVLPMNFDLAAFQEALRCRGASDPGGPDHPGELGCYFTPAGFMKRRFNGIIYVTNTWENSLAGFGPKKSLRGSAAPVRVKPPYMHDVADVNFNGANADSAQAPVLHAAQQSSLPFQVCSTSFATKKFDANGMFKVPSCARYQNAASSTSIRTRTGSIRIVNGQNIDRTILTTGLTFASNMMTFVAGDLNANSDVSSATAAAWVPVMIAGDDIVTLSRAWADHNARWDVAMDTLVSYRVADSTTYNASMLQASPMPLLNENWMGKTLTVNGARIHGHMSSFNPSGWAIASGNSTFYWPSTELRRFDPHLSLLVHQPLGVSYLTLFTTSGWSSK